MAFRTMQSLFHALPKTSTAKPISRFLIKSTPAVSSNRSSLLSFGQFSSAPPPLVTFSGLKQPLPRMGVINANMNPFHQPQRNFHLLIRHPVKNGILQSSPLMGSDISNQTRSVTKFSLKKGTRKTVKAIICRFYRLDWGIWIHPKSGRHKKLWKKGKLRRKRLRQHVFTNAWQTRICERMTTRYWHKKKYWVDDPYEPYHKRDNFAITKNTRNIYDQLI